MVSTNTLRVIPCVLFEDEHLLVVDKPAGVNTHAPSPFAGEGIYDWLRHREPRWAALAIIHRLDKETSGVMLFGKTPLANRSLTEQFAARTVRKQYLLLTDRPVQRAEFTVKTEIRRMGEAYASGAGGEAAETHFRVLERQGGLTAVAAEPRTGRTHQIRVHAAESGFPILGDTLYGGTAAERVFLHAAGLSFKHPQTGVACEFKPTGGFGVAASAGRECVPPKADCLKPGLRTSIQRRLSIIDATETNSFRLIQGAGDGWPGWYVDRLGDHLLSQGEFELTADHHACLAGLLQVTGTQGAYHKLLSRQVRRTTPAGSSPALALGEAALDRFEIRENGVRYEISFAEGYSVGLFLDQRDNRRKFLTRHIAAGFPAFNTQEATRKPELLNCFAYTCGFSVCAALGGMHTTSLDLSKKYLEWGKRNFALNGLNPAEHGFIFGDTFDWLRRFTKKGRTFNAIVLDPPTFSQSKLTGVFRAEKDYHKLVAAALGVLKPNGILLASTNAAEWPPDEFVATVEAAVRSSGRKPMQQHFVPQPMDFPISRQEPAYLKTLWMRVG
jgi:23S rRNA (cytosine1962-C5)-methyltransferase